MLEGFDNKRISKLGLGIFLVLLGAFLFFTLKAYIVSFLGALIFYVLFKPFMAYLCEKKKWGRGWAAATISIISFLVILLPVFLMVYMIVPKVSLFFSDTSMVMQTIRDADEKIRSLTGIKLLSEQNLLSIQEKATEYITAFLSESLNMLVILGIMYIVLFYMLKNYATMEAGIKAYLPFHERNLQTFTQELKSQTYSNAVGAPIYGLLQGAIAALGYWFFGLSEPVFWGIMTGLFSFVPFVGSMAIWLPAAIIMISSGFVWQGIALIAYGLLVISLVDNVFLMAFQKKFANVHPLVTIFGFIIGVDLFGVPGIIFGPLLISYFILLLKIYREEFIDTDHKLAADE
jgi:predicted PurR-regulated permease PerM